MTLTEGRSRFSALCSSMVLLLAVCDIILECQAVPGPVGMDVTKAHKVDLIALLQNVEEATPNAGPHPDGTACFGGVPVPAPDKYQAESRRQKYLKEFNKTAPHFVWKEKYLDPGVMEVALKELSSNCTSKKCSWDIIRVNYVCGDVGKQGFEDGRICSDGAAAPPFKDKGTELLEVDQIDLNREATVRFGHYCISNSCYVHHHKDNAYLCSSSYVQPILIILVALFGLGVL